MTGASQPPPRQFQQEEMEQEEMELENEVMKAPEDAHSG